MKTFNVNIVTPEESVWDGQVQSLVAPGLDGYLGVLANHAPLLGALGEGDLRLTTPENNEIHFQISGGFLEVLNNDVTFLADQAEILN